MFVQRVKGVIVGAFTNLQPGFAEEELAPDSPELLVFLDPPAPAPTSVTMRQARRALLNAGLLATVDAAIAGMAGPAGDAARIDWEFSSDVLRSWPLVAALMPVLNLSDAQVDALFVAAAKL